MTRGTLVDERERERELSKLVCLLEKVSVQLLTLDFLLFLYSFFMTFSIASVGGACVVHFNPLRWRTITSGRVFFRTRRRDITGEKLLKSNELACVTFKYT